MPDTTVLYVELLVIGLQACAWLLLLAASIPGSDRLWTSSMCLVDNVLIQLGFVLVLAYVLGIVFDKVAHFFVGAQSPFLRWLEDVCDVDESKDKESDRPFGSIVKWLQRFAVRDEPWNEEPDTTLRSIYAQIMVEEGGAVSDVLYGRHKVRILRASVINVPLILVD